MSDDESEDVGEKEELEDEMTMLEAKVAELLGIPPTVSQCALLPVAFYTGDSFHPAPRRSVDEVTYLNGWKKPVR